MTAPPRRNRPSCLATEAVSKSSTAAVDYSQFSVLGLDPCEPLTAENRYKLAVLAEAKALGFTLAVRCTRCRKYLVTPKSLAAHMGPVCRGKVANNG